MNEVRISIVDIRLTNWNVLGPFEQDKGQLKLDINTRIDSHPAKRQLDVVISVNFYNEKDPEHTILNAEAMTQFALEIDEDSIRENRIDIPDQAVITMISIGISHARALVTTQSKALGLQGISIPILNPTVIFKQIKEKWELNSKAGKE